MYVGLGCVILRAFTIHVLTIMTLQTQKEHVMERQFLAALFIHYLQNQCNKAINMNDLDRFNQLAYSQANLVLCPKTLHDEKADFFKDCS